VTATEPAARLVLPPIALSEPAQLDITAYRGDSGRFRVTVTQDGAPLDVSAATWDCDIRAQPDAPVLASMTVTPVVGTTNAVDVLLPANATSNVSGEAVWDLEMTMGTDPDITTTTLLRGNITFTPDVSRPVFTPPPDPGTTEAAGKATSGPVLAAGGPGAAPLLAGPDMLPDSPPLPEGGV
jgi:hypothetical protein